MTRSVVANPFKLFCVSLHTSNSRHHQIDANIIVITALLDYNGLCKLHYILQTSISINQSI